MELGRRQPGVRLGRRHLAGGAARAGLGPRLLGQVPGGFQWVSGYWASAAALAAEVGQADQSQYLPCPPASLDYGPVGQAPSAGCTWDPGCWIYVNGCYNWQPGRWIAGRPGCDWIGGHYRWTPRGYVFVRGYWDFPVGHRGWAGRPTTAGPRVSRSITPGQSRTAVRPNGTRTTVRPTKSNYPFTVGTPGRPAGPSGNSSITRIGSTGSTGSPTVVTRQFRVPDPRLTTISPARTTIVPESGPDNNRAGPSAYAGYRERSWGD